MLSKHEIAGVARHQGAICIDCERARRRGRIAADRIFREAHTPDVEEFPKREVASDIGLDVDDAACVVGVDWR